MRLLQRSETGEISLTDDLIGDDQIPPYAILSHTWGNPQEEVTFKDMTNGTGEQKIGYEKIRFCGDQAMRDGLRYFWVDTCCIDKSSSAELSEAINSMYRWYEESRVCYVYLQDVIARKDPPWNLPDDGHMEEDERIQLEESDFAQSRWFTRGWTLQELLAPRNINFYSKDWIPLGDLNGLLAALVHITRIDYKALSPKWREWSLNRICVARKMSWAARRQTTRLEDQAYCLMGIFNVQMPLLYGEGRRAFVRLQEEILKSTDDDSLLAWDIPNWGEHIQLQDEIRRDPTSILPTEGISSYTFERIKYRSDEILAPSPACFKSSRKLIRGARSRTEPWFMSNLGLTITMELTPTVWGDYIDGQSHYYAILDCRDEDDLDHRLALHGVRGSKGDSAMCLYLWDRVYEPRVHRLSRRQLDNSKRSIMYESIILLRQRELGSRTGTIPDVAIVTMDTTFNTQIRTDHVISIKVYYPSTSWNMEAKRLSMAYCGDEEQIAAVRLMFKGEDLLLVLQPFHYPIIPPVLIHYPHGSPGLRSVVSQIPKLLKSELSAYGGPLRFQYMYRKGERHGYELLLKACLTTRTTSTEGPESESHECDSAQFEGALYVRWPGGIYPGTDAHQSSQHKNRFWDFSKYFSK